MRLHWPRPTAGHCHTEKIGGRVYKRGVYLPVYIAVLCGIVFCVQFDHVVSLSIVLLGKHGT